MGQVFSASRQNKSGEIQENTIFLEQTEYIRTYTCPFTETFIHKISILS